MRTLVWVAMAIAGSVMLTGCGGSDSDSDEQEPAKQRFYPDAAAYCAARAKALCSDAIVRDCAITKDYCEVVLRGRCGNDILEGVYRADVAEICVNAISAAYADAVLMPAEQANIDRDCSLVFGGRSIAGAACTTLKDCNLDLGLECVRGTCQKPRTLNPGEMCDEADTVCAKGYYCEHSSAACVVQLGEGQPCNAIKICAEGFYCAGAETVPDYTDGTCQANLSDEEICDSNVQCSSGLCTLITLESWESRCKSKQTFAPADPFCQIAAGN